MTGKITISGKQFFRGGQPVTLRGVTYGTFQPRSDGSRYPERDQVKKDFAAIHAAGFNAVRTYTVPPDDVLELASDWNLQLLVGAHHSDWRYLIGASFRGWRRAERQARAKVVEVARRLEGCEHVTALVVGNEMPADVVRWVGTRRAADYISRLAEAVVEADPDRLKTYGNYPTSEFLDPSGLDFVMVNLYLEDPTAFRRYLTRLHHLAGDRPLVLGEMGIDAGTTRQGERRQADTLEWQLEIATERGVAGTTVFTWTDDWWVGDAPVSGWHFGLTHADRSPRPALRAASTWNQRSVRDLGFNWPSISIVICAYNASATLDETLQHACGLDYPDMEIIVVDDGSTDHTAAIVGRHPKARLICVPHVGLSTARNYGLWASSKELVAYLDADAYPTPDWPYFLALAFDAPGVNGAGGPNVPPLADPPNAQLVARVPGGPAHVLMSDDRAEHVPGCNMAFWRETLVELGGFDPVFEAAGDDVDLCWRLLDAGGQIGFHPAAVVWHHRRSSARAFLRQQRSYGHSEALVEARHPNRFTDLGSARWHGTIYGASWSRPGRQRIYRGEFGTSLFQSIYRSDRHTADIAHQLGVPVACASICTAPLALIAAPLLLPAILGLLLLAGLGVTTYVATVPAAIPGFGRHRARAILTVLTLLQPVARTWGRVRNRDVARRRAPASDPTPVPVRRAPGRVLVYTSTRPRAELAEALIALLRKSGMRVKQATAWEDHDARIAAGPFVRGEFLTSEHPTGYVQVRVRQRPRGSNAIAALALVILASLMSAALCAVLVVGIMAWVGWGVWRTGPAVTQALLRSNR
jgi:glycosyltransferase involved in cell wall biosynthesis